MARRAGMFEAANASSVSRRETQTKVKGSLAVTPSHSLEISSENFPNSGSAERPPLSGLRLAPRRHVPLHVFLAAKSEA